MTIELAARACVAAVVALVVGLLTAGCSSPPPLDSTNIVACDPHHLEGALCDGRLPDGRACIVCTSGGEPVYGCFWEEWSEVCVRSCDECP